MQKEVQDKVQNICQDKQVLGVKKNHSLNSSVAH